jgi:hypothetical protein
MEIKILCPCGAKFKFQVEPVNGQSPGPVHCPSCGKDSTEETNALIRQQLAAPPAAPSVAPSAPRISIPAAPTPAVAATASGEAGPKVAIPAVRIPAAPISVSAQPAAAPIHVSAAAAPSPAPVAAPAPIPPKPAQAAPVAAVGPKMTVMPVPETTKSLSVKPPGEVTHETPPSAAPANASGDPKAPGSPKMAFMPAPVAGTGKALSVSGHAKADEKPAEAAAVSPTAPEPTRAHPAAAKMVKASAGPGGANLGKGITGAIIGCLLGAGIWYVIAVNFVALRLLAWIPGFVGGLAAVLLARKTSEKLGKAAAIVAGVVTILAQIAVIAGINDKRLTEASEDSYRERMALAKKASDAKSDDDIRKLIDEDPDYDGINATSLRETLRQVAKKAEKIEREEADKAAGKDPGDAEQIANYRNKRVPELIKFSQGDPSRSRFLEKERARLEEQGDVLYRKKYLSMGIWIFASIEAAYLIGCGKKKK